MMDCILRGEYPNEMFNKNTLSVITIKREEVEKKDLTPIINVIEKLKKQAIKSKGNLAIIFDGYNDDPREIYEIGEIRTYVEALFVRYSYFPYFLTNIEAIRSIIFACLCDIVSCNPENKIVNPVFDILDGKEVQYGKAQFYPPTYVKKRFENGMKKFGNKIGEDKENIKKIIEDTYYGGVDNKPISREAMLETFRETFINASVSTWNLLVSGSDKHDEVIGIEELTFSEANDKIEELYKEIDLIANKHKEAIMVPLFKDKNIRYNLSIHSNDKSICECGGDNIVVFKRNIVRYTIEDCNNELMLFPSVEFYIKNKISPLEDSFMRNLPVPIVKGEDKYYCLKCKTWHTF